MCERRRPPRAVERRDKRGEEKHSEADPAQTATEGQADRAVDLGADRRRTKRRIHVDSAAVLLHEDSVRGGEEDEESTNADG